MVPQYAVAKQHLAEDVRDANIVELTPAVIASATTVLEGSLNYLWRPKTQAEIRGPCAPLILRSESTHAREHASTPRPHSQPPTVHIPPAHRSLTPVSTPLLTPAQPRP